MVKYIIKRFFYMIFVWIILSILMFFIYNLTPNNRAYTEAKQEKTTTYKHNDEVTLEDLYVEYQYRYGTEDEATMLVRYLRWVGVCRYNVYDRNTKEVTKGEYNGMLQGNFGYSYELKTEVINGIKEPMKNTIFINIFATIAALAITIPLGIACAVKKGGTGDKVMQVLTIIGYSLPTFLIAILFIYLFCWVGDVFPASGMGTPGATYTGWELFKDKMYYLALPLIVMTFCSLGGMTRYVRASMIEALSMDCIRTARAKGLKEKTVIFSHAWRNALIPIITLVVGWFLGIFSGSVMIEQIFGLNGMGNLLYSSLTTSDFDVILFLQMFYVTIGLLGNLLIDLAYGFADPRVRVNK